MDEKNMEDAIKIIKDTVDSFSSIFLIGIGEINGKKGATFICGGDTEDISAALAHTALRQPKVKELFDKVFMLTNYPDILKKNLNQ